MIDNTKILLVHPQKIVREGLSRLIEAEPGVQGVGEAEDGHAAVAMVEELAPDVVVIHINLPDYIGIETIRRLRAGKTRDVGPKVIALSGYSDGRFVSEILAAGAVGYLFKEAPFQEFSHAVRHVMANTVYLSPSAVGMIADQLSANKARIGSPLELSVREHDILKLVANGNATKEIATHLRISNKTVETHRRNIMDKLGMESVAELTKYAIRHGLTSLEK